MLVPIALIVPNLKTVTRLGLYDTLAGVMAPYRATAFGTFLMRQTFRTVPREFEEAALIDGATLSTSSAMSTAAGETLDRRLLDRLGHRALERISVAADGHQLTVTSAAYGRPRHVHAGRRRRAGVGRGGGGNAIVIPPLVIAFLLFQRQFVESFMASGLK